MWAVMLVAVMALASCMRRAHTKLLLPHNVKNEAFQAVESITRQLTCEHMTLLLTDGRQELEAIQAPHGVTVFQVEGENLPSNATPPQLETTVEDVRQLGEAWHCLVVVVVSDDPAFLAAFAHLSLSRHALRWSTRILVLTRLPLSHLGGLQNLLSNRNAMLLHVQEDEATVRSVSRVGLLVWHPYSAPNSTPLRVATWTPDGRLTLTSDKSLFPNKFYMFSSAPTLKTAIEVLPHNRISWLEDPDAPGGRRLEFKGYVDNIVRHFAKAVNFTPLYALSPERTFGTRLPDGSWTGLIGMLVRQEADFSPCPFIMSPVRKEVVDHSSTMCSGNLRILSGLSRLTIDPWGFLLPLTPLVWAITLAALLGVLLVLQLFSSCLPGRSLLRSYWSAYTFSPVRVLLQQDVVWPVEWWWWERLVLGLWMLTTLVLTRSYAGNLMSLLAVRYVPQPFQTLRDILDHPHVALIGQKHSNFEQNLRDVKTGLYKEVASLEGKGRLEFHIQSQYLRSLDNLVRRGHHVLVDPDINLKSLIALDFSQEGQCDFYISRDGFLPYTAFMVFPKASPLIHSFSKRLQSATEQGLITYWMENVPNFTECENVPKKILVTSHISLSNIWGVFAVLAASQVAGLLVLVAETAATPAE